MYNWGKTQQLSLIQQLETGVRYLDLRVAFNNQTCRIHVLHGLYGECISLCLERMHFFLDCHPKEVLLLDFNHFYNMEPVHHMQLIKLLQRAFKGLLFKRNDLKHTTLRFILERKCRLVVFYHHPSASSCDDLWPSTSVSSPWPNTMDVSECLTFLTQQLANRRSDQFYVCQGVLTPGVEEVLTHVYSTLVVECAKKVNPFISSWIKRLPIKDHGMIYITDCVEICSIPSVVINLNLCISSFGKILRVFLNVMNCILFKLFRSVCKV